VVLRLLLVLAAGSSSLRNPVAVRHAHVKGVEGTEIQSLYCVKAIGQTISRRVHTRDLADRASVAEKPTCLTCKYDPA